MTQYNLKSFFDGLQILEPQRIYKNVVLLPVRSSRNGSIKYISLYNAVYSKLAEVTEVSESGTVPKVRVINKSDEYILIPQGEHLIGAKQNRIVNISILVEPRKEVLIPVSCIEQGRWHYTRREFLPGTEFTSYKLRKVASKGVAKSVSETGELRADQSEIWNFIDDELKKNKIYSETSSYSDYMSKKLEKEKKDDIEGLKFRLTRNINGIAIFVGDKLLSFEFFSDQKYFENMIEQITKALLVDAQDYEHIEFNPETDYKFIFMSSIGKLFNAKQFIKDSVGVGTNYSILDERNNINSNFLVYNDELIHMVSFF